MVPSLVSEHRAAAALSLWEGGGMYGGRRVGAGAGLGRLILREEFHIGSGVWLWVRSRCKGRLLIGAPQSSALTCGGVGEDGLLAGGSKAGVGWRVGGSGAQATDDAPLGESVQSCDKLEEP